MQTVLPEVSLNPSSAVTYRGVGVGKVAAIELDPVDPTRVRLTFSIRADAPVKTDTVATLAMQGLTGLGSVELTGGSRDAPLLHDTPGSRYPVIPMQPSLMNRLDTALRLAMSTLDQVSQRLLLLDDRNVGAIGAILANVEQATGTLAGQGERLERTLADIERLAAAGAQAGEALPQLAPRLQAVLEQTEPLLTTRRTSGEQVGSTARDSRCQLTPGGVAAAYVLLQQAVQEVAGFCRRATPDGRNRRFHQCQGWVPGLLAPTLTRPAPKRGENQPAAPAPR